MYGRRAKGWVTSWTDDGRIPPHVSLLESAAPQEIFLKRALGFLCNVKY